jgi:hypothetical protein
MPYRDEPETPQPHFDLTRDARRIVVVVVVVRSDESDADPSCADLIGGGPHARFGVTPQLG